MRNTVNRVFVSGKHIDVKYTVVIGLDNILEELKHTVSMKAPHLEQISKAKNSAGVYTIIEDTYDILVDLYK